MKQQNKTSVKHDFKTNLKAYILEKQEFLLPI